MAKASSGNFYKNKSLRLAHGPTAGKLCGWGPTIYLIKPPRWPWCSVKFENPCTGSWLLTRQSHSRDRSEEGRITKLVPELIPMSKIITSWIRDASVVQVVEHPTLGFGSGRWSPVLALCRAWSLHEILSLPLLLPLLHPFSRVYALSLVLPKTNNNNKKKLPELEWENWRN